MNPAESGTGQGASCGSRRQPHHQGGDDAGPVVGGPLGVAGGEIAPLLEAVDFDLTATRRPERLRAVRAP